MKLTNLLLPIIFLHSFGALGYFGDYIDFQIELNNPSETVVFLHGAGSSPATWQKVGPQFDSIFKTLFYNTSRIDSYSGHHSGDHKEELTLQDWARDLASFLDEENTKSVHLVAHSFGARLAVKFWELYPKRVKSIVIEDMDLVPRNFPEYTSDPFNYPAAASDLRYVFELQPSIPVT